MRILVTGGCGFIGSHLVNRLIEEGHSVSIIDKTPAYRVFKTDKIQMIQGDFGDVNLLQNCLDGVDVIFHLAWTTIPKTSNENPIFDVSSNLIGTIKLLEAGLHSGVKRIIFNSTGGTIYGPSISAPVSENNITNPICSYGITKLAAEKYLGLFQHINNLDYVIFRTSNAYGPRQNPQCGVGFITAALYSVTNQKPIDVWGDGTIIRDYIFIDDITQALIMAADIDFPGGIYHLSSGVGLSINEVIEIIGKVTGTEPDVRYTSGRSCDVSKVVLDNTKLQRTGWIPRVSIDRGIYKTWRWMVSQ